MVRPFDRSNGMSWPGGIGWLRSRAGGLLCLAIACGLSTGVAAGELVANRVLIAQATAPTTPEMDELFQQLLKDPKNVELTFKYAESAIKAGNLEAGISSLERLLLLDRNFPGVKLQIADLYSRLRSYDMARAYLLQAEQEPGVNQQELARIAEMRAEIDSATSPSKFGVNVFAGVRIQTRAGAEPAGADIVAGGVPQTLSAVSLNRSGSDLFATGNVRHTYDFGDWTLESNGIAYYSRQIPNRQLDVGAIEINSGPRLDVGSGDMKFSIRPYIVTNEIGLGDSQYLHSLGAGIGIDHAITDKLFGLAFYEYRAEWFNNVRVSPSAVEQSSGVHSLGTGFSYQVTDSGTLGFQFSYAITDAFASVGSSTGLVARLGYSQQIDLPSDFGVGPLLLSPVLYRIYNWDNGPLPFSPISGTTQEWRYGMTAKLGLGNNIAANVNVIREVISSNIVASRSHDVQVIFGLVLGY
jgi:hypothetical protein